MLGHRLGKPEGLSYSMKVRARCPGEDYSIAVVFDGP